MNLAPLADAAVMAAAGAITTLVAMLIPRIPLLVTWLRVSVNGADNTLLRHAIGNAARRAVAAIEGGMRTEDAIAGMVAYVRENLPQAVARLGVGDATLLTMCSAELARVQAGQG